MSLSANSNIFNLDHPTEFWCRVSSLVSAHTTMRIDIIPAKQDTIPLFGENMYLEFRKVQYFSGWLGWMGANFRQADVKEKAQFIRKVSHLGKDYETLPDSELVLVSEFATFTLFIVESRTGLLTYILANAGRLVDKNNQTILEVG